IAETSTTSDHMATTRRRGQPAALSPLDDDMPSVRLDTSPPATRGNLHHPAAPPRRGHPAALSPLEDDMPSGRLDRATPASRDTLPPPWSTVRPSTNDSGMPSRTDPSTIA